MIYRIEVNRESDKLPIYRNQFSQDNDIWIVGDLRTKMYLQELSLERHNYFLTESHQRASDFWLYLFKRFASDYIIVEPQFLKVWLEENLIDHEPLDSLLRKQSSEFYIQMIKALGPLVWSDHGEADMSLYFSNNPQSASRWQHWYSIALKLSQVLLNQKKWIITDWLPHLVLNLLELNSISLRTQKIFVDLGPDLKLVEAQLFNRLSHNHEVYIIEPKFELKDMQALYFTQSYRHLDHGIKIELSKESSQASQAKTKVSCLVHSTELGQFKDMFEKTRQMIKSGYEPKDIVWLIPKIEKALPIIMSLSQDYDINIILPMKIKVTSFPIVMNWLQRLKAKSGQFNLGTIEVVPSFSMFSIEQKRIWLRKANLIEEIPDSIRSIIEQQRVTAAQLRMSDFIELIFREWPSEKENKTLIKILNAFMCKVEPSSLISYSGWLRVLESILPFIESNYTDIPSGGIKIFSISEWSLSSSKVLVVGSLIQDYFKNSEPIFIQPHDIEVLNRDFGYQLNHPHFDIGVLDLHWILQSSQDDVILNGFHLDIKGTNQALHPFILNRLNSSEIVSPIHLYKDVNTKDIENSFKVIDQQKFYELGITRFETFAKCSFKFHLESTMKMENISELDFDIDVKSEGSLNHKIMELMLKNWDKDLLRPQFKTRLISEAVNESRTIFRNGLEVLVRQDMELFYDNFYRAEVQFRTMFPNAKVVALEFPVEAILDLRSKTFLDLPPDHFEYIKFKGVVDRIDQVGDYFVIVDYKRSIKSEYSLSSWTKFHFYQLYFYGKAFSLWQNLQPRPLKWAGAEILSYGNFDRGGGFLLSEITPDYRERPRPSKDVLTLSDLEEVLIPSINSMVEVGQKMIQNRVSLIVPQPVRGICDYCSWRSLCRAPHLQ